jgi:hypothetical protein
MADASSRGGIAPLIYVLLLVSAVCGHALSAPSGTAPFILDGNRVYAQVAFVLPDGQLRKTLVFVDLGSPSMVLSQKLYDDLQIGAGKSLTFRVEEMDVAVESTTVTSDAWLPFSIGDDRKVEGLLAAGVLQKYQARFDYAHHTMTLAQPRTLRSHGTAVPFRLNEKTGLIAIDAKIDGQLYPITIDNGSGYTWIRKSTAQEWLSRHPNWLRGTGAVGPSNMRMADDGIETAGALVRIPEFTLRSLRVQQAGALAIEADDSGHDFIDWYSTKNAVPVIGWLGGNVLRHFQITIDYAERLSYWVRQSAPDPHDLNYIGLTLTSRHGEYFVAGIATKDAQPTVQGVQVGDKLLQIGALHTSGASREVIFAAMHGKPGEIRSLILERDNRRIRLPVKVTAF